MEFVTKEPLFLAVFTYRVTPLFLSTLAGPLVIGFGGLGLLVGVGVG